MIEAERIPTQDDKIDEVTVGRGEAEDDWSDLDISDIKDS